MDKLKDARKELKNLYSTDDDKLKSVVVTSFTGWTVLVTENNFGEDFPMAELFQDADLLTIYDYAERFYSGDPAFDGFNGELIDITGEFSDAFYDIYNAFTKKDSNCVYRIISFKEFLKQIEHKPEVTE